MKNSHLLSMAALGLLTVLPAHAQDNVYGQALSDLMRAINPGFGNPVRNYGAINDALKNAEMMSPDDLVKATALLEAVENNVDMLGTQKVEKALEQVIAIREKIAGKDSELLVKPLCELSKVKSQDQEKASLLARALKIERVHMKSDDPVFISTMENLAQAYLYSNNQPESIKLRKELLDMAINSRASATQVAIRKGELAGVYTYNSETWSKAADMFKEVAKTFDADPGADKSVFTDFLLTYGQTLNRQKRYAEAEPVFRKARALLIKASEKKANPIGPLNFKMNRIIEGLAKSCLELGKLGESEELYKRSLEMCLNEWGQFEAPHGYNNLAEFYLRTGKYSEAETNYKAEIEILEKSRSFNRVQLPDALYGLATTYRYQGKLPSAVGILNREIAECDKKDESENASDFMPMKRQSKIDALNTLAYLYQAMGNKNDQLAIEEKLYAACKAEVGGTPRKLFEGLCDKALINDEIDHQAQAKDWYQRAIKYGEKYFPTDPRLKKTQASYAVFLKRVNKTMTPVQTLPAH